MRLTVDDLGTGYSSLSYLTRLPVGRLKIDRSFIMTLTTNPQAATVAAAIIGLAEDLQLSVVAEGIETAEEQEMLVALGCGYGQGCLHGRPMAQDRATALLTGRTTARLAPHPG